MYFVANWYYRNIPGDRLLYPRLLTDTLRNSVPDRSSYTLLLTDIPVDLDNLSVYHRLLTVTRTSRYNVAGRSLSLPDIQVYTSSDRPLYPGLLTDILGNSVADNVFVQFVADNLFRYTIQVTGCNTPRYWLTQGYSVADRSSYTLSPTDILQYTPSVKELNPELLTNTQENSVAYEV